jgi:hypothetical protein
MLVFLLVPGLMNVTPLFISMTFRPAAKEPYELLVAVLAKE